MLKEKRIMKKKKSFDIIKRKDTDEEDSLPR